MSTIVTDTITGKSTATTITIGSTPVVSASANSMTIRGEGSNQTSIQQGLLKHFATVQGTDTFATIDSFNQASATDNGTGDYSVTNTTAFREARATRLVYMGNTVNEGSSIGVVATRAGMQSSGHFSAPTTTVFRANIYFGSTGSSDGGAQDSSYVYFIGAGDLS